MGVPVAGPMDPYSHRVANALVLNSRGAATLEVALVGPELEFEDDRLVAVAGAEFDLDLDGAAVALHVPFVARAGWRLRFGGRRRGSRCYVAIAGGVAVAPVMGSRATHLVGRLGGFEGRALAAGDWLPLGEVSTAQAQRRTSFPVGALKAIGAGSDARVRLLPGPHRGWFAADALDVLQSNEYSLGSQSDRMGFRLEGPRLQHVRGAELISEATPLGSLQVPPSGQPVLLMADRQTTGGYPKIATVITADISLAGQLGPGDRISFRLCTPADAIAALIAQEKSLMALETAMR
jgi:antagonist of KipI